MGFWIFMFIMTLLIPMTLLLIWYICPKISKINGTIGYRTPRSMKNQDSWDFAQKECAKNSLILFFPTLFLSVVVMPFFTHERNDIIGWIGLFVTVVQLISFGAIIFMTERALKRNNL